MSPSKHPNFTAENQPIKGSRKDIPNTKTIIEQLLDNEVEVTEGVYVSKRMAIIDKQIDKALKGDSLAFSRIMDRKDGKPVQTNVIEDQSNVLNILRSEEKSDT